MVLVRLPYELKTLNGQKIVVVYKPEGVTHAKKEYPNTPIYSFREIEALEGLETVEQRLLQEAKQIFGGAIFTEELFDKHYPSRKVRTTARNREFDDTLDELKMLHDAKNHDYATTENPYKNLEGVERIGIERGEVS